MQPLLSPPQCPQCVDIETTGKRTALRAARRLARDEAHRIACDKASQRLLNRAEELEWADLYCAYFRRIHDKLYRDEYKRVFDAYQTAAYTTPYPGREQYICSYHAEFRG